MILLVLRGLRMLCGIPASSAVSVLVDQAPQQVWGLDKSCASLEKLDRSPLRIHAQAPQTAAMRRCYS